VLSCCLAALRALAQDLREGVRAFEKEKDGKPKWGEALSDEAVSALFQPIDPVSLVRVCVLVSLLSWLASPGLLALACLPLPAWCMVAGKAAYVHACKLAFVHTCIPAGACGDILCVCALLWRDSISSMCVQCFGEILGMRIWEREEELTGGAGGMLGLLQAVCRR